MSSFEVTINIPELDSLANAINHFADVMMRNKSWDVMDKATKDECVNKVLNNPETIVTTEELKNETKAADQVKPVEEKPEKEETPAPAEESKKEVPEVSYTKEDVRGVLMAAMKAGKKKEVNALIKSYGVSRLGDIPEDKYAEVIKRAGEF